jgi:CRP-like cAMP-binding protein
MGWFDLDYCIHAANIMLLAAYSVRDILWLRLFAVASSTIAMPYFLFQPTHLWAAFGWSVLFTGINLYQSWRLFRERRPVQLSAEEEEVRRLVFPDLPPRDVLRVINIGSWANPALGERMIERGKSVDAISLIVRGRVQVTMEGRVLGEMGPGGIVGSSLVLSGAPAEVDAVTMEPARTLRWDVPTLERYLEAKPEARNALQRRLARDLAGKVQHIAKVASGVPFSGRSSTSAR